jgi:hypothetical protein
MLAKLYVDYLILRKSSYIKHIPHLMLAYLKELNRNLAEGKIENDRVLNYTSIVAWECIKKKFHAQDTHKSNIMKSLPENELKAEEFLKYLQQSLHIIHSINPEENQIRFNLDPLCEYLAAWYISEEYGTDKTKWNDFWHESSKKSSDIQIIQGFLLAVIDCCEAKGINSNVPDDISKKLGIFKSE